MIYLLEIPHQKPPSFTAFNDKADFVSTMQTMAECIDYDRYEITAADLADWYIDDDEIPADLAKIIETDGVAIEVNRWGVISYHTIADAPDEFEFWQDFALDDLHSGIVGTKQEIIDFVALYRGHQQIRTNSIVQTEFDLED